MIFARKVMLQRSVLMAKIIKKLFEKRNLRHNNMRLKRSPPDIPRNPNPDYWLSPWGQLLTRFASVVGGPSIGSWEGKLFRRRFRVPYDVFCKLVTMSLDKKLFGLYCESKCMPSRNKAIGGIENTGEKLEFSWHCGGNINGRDNSS